MWILGILGIPCGSHQERSRVFEYSGWLVHLFIFLTFPTVNVGDYIQAVLDRNLAENISRVLYPNDNVSDQVCVLSGNRSLFQKYFFNSPIKHIFNIDFFFLHAE